MQTQTLTFGGSTVTLESEGTHADRLVQQLLANIAPDRSAPDRGSSWTLRLVSQQGRPAHLFSGACTATLQPLGETTAEQVLGHLCYRLAAGSQGGVLFHAAGACHAGQGWLLPGKVGAGKTTLAAWLVASHYTYLSDELVFVANGSLQMQGFSRPLNLRAGGLAALQAATSLVVEDNTAAKDANTLVAPHYIGPGKVSDQAMLCAILFPHYAANCTFSCTPLSQAEAGLALMECLINARNLPNHGFTEVTRLARHLPAYRLTYSNFEQLHPWFLAAEKPCGKFLEAACWPQPQRCTAITL